jgi:hypothetical protein
VGKVEALTSLHQKLVGVFVNGKWLPEGELALRKDGRPAVDGIQPGDELISPDGLNTSGATLDAVNRSLHGRPGDERKVRLSRKGKEIEPEAAVQRML